MIFTAHDTAEGLKTGVRRTGDFLQGFQDQIVDTFNPVNIYKSAHEFGVHEANIYIPDPDGHVEDGDAYARQMGHAVLDSFNPLNKKSAKEAGRSTANIAMVVVPGAQEMDALKGLKVAARAADGDVVAASAAAERAAGTPGAAAAEDALRAAKARQAAAHEAYQAKLPGTGARKMAAKARAAGAKAKERRAGGAAGPAEPAPRTPEQVAAAEQKFHAQKQEALDEARHRQSSQRRPALAGGRSHPAGVARPSEAPGGPSTAAIGKPGGKSGAIRMAKGLPRSPASGSGLSPEAKAAIEKLENIKKDPVGEINSEKDHNHYAAAREEAQGTPGIGTPGKKINPKTKRPYSHIGELQEARNGLDKVSKVLKRELENKNGTLTDEARKTLIARYQEAQQMQKRLEGFLNSIGYGGPSPIHSF